MVCVLKGSEHSRHSALFDQLFRLRHSVFIEQRGWSLPSKGGYEIDEYDTDEAVYFIDLDETGKIQGTVRITPTLTSSLTSDYFPHLLEKPNSGRHEQIYEATRYIVQPSIESRESKKNAKARLLIALTKWCMDNNISGLQTIIDAGTLNGYLEFNPFIKPLGLPHPYGGGRKVRGGGHCVAIIWPNRSEVIEHIQNLIKPTKKLQSGSWNLGSEAALVH